MTEGMRVQQLWRHGPGRASMLQHMRGRHTLLAFLSKCYERVGRALAGARAVASWIQGKVVNMVFDLHQGDRHVRAHGAVAQPRRGNHGLVAGCAFAKDILKACTRPLKQECPGGRPPLLYRRHHAPGARRHSAELRSADERTVEQAQRCAEEEQHGPQ